MDSTNMILSILHKLQSANEAYRNGTPTMSDAEYDDLWDRLVVLTDAGDENNPNVIEAKAFLASVGAPVADGSGWAKVRHAAPMGSLNKAQTEQEALDWYRACGGNTGLIVSEKLDGISCFDASTPVHLANGETISIGDIVQQNLRPAVLTWDPKQGLHTSQITAVHDNGLQEDWLRLTLEDGSTILVTGNHLFYVKDKGWIPARDLLGEDIVEPNEQAIV